MMPIYFIIYFFFQAHEDSCQYGDVLCGACSKVMQRRLLESHETDECINRALECTHCGGQVRLSDMKVFFYT